MGNRFLHMEENDDGTITCTVKVEREGGEIQFLLPMSFDHWLDSLRGADTLSEMSKIVEDNAVIIPSYLDD